MESISNDIQALMNEAEPEIENFRLKSGEKIIAYLSELPTIKGFPYKIILVEQPDGIVYSAFRQWDTAYNLSQWTLGIYSLERLKIINDEKILSTTDTAILREQFSLLEQIKLPESISDEKAIILDGSEWKLGISLPDKNVDYTWKASTEDINLLVPVIELMRKQYFED